ncbi:MAG: hypothetical protein MUC97_11880 [Bernardetiaceae bacterium]|nr:hypothetical protein [Bernardetiaceae bacterium]
MNTQNAGVKRAAELARYENISPEEWEQAKLEASRRKVITLEREEPQTVIAKTRLLNQEQVAKIVLYTGLTTNEQVAKLRQEMGKLD